MGGALEPASALSDARGQVVLRTEGQQVPGTAWGYFRIAVSKDASGNESLPARYNTATTLGQEVRLNPREAVVLRLTS